MDRQSRHGAEPRSLAPAESARALVQSVFDHEAVLRTILAETVESARAGRIRESGRTFCPRSWESVRGPAARFPRAVRLESCPIGAGAIVHTHVTHGQLLDPEHSLPDVANVLYTDLDASVVLGVESADVLLGPRDEAAARARFADALGVSIDDPAAVVDALESGRIPDPAAARADVRAALAPLFEREPTSYPGVRADLDALRADGVIAPAPAGAGPLVGCDVAGSPWPAAPQPTARLQADLARLQADLARHADELATPVIDLGPREEGTSPLAGDALKTEVAGTVLGILVGGAINWIYFGSRSG